MSNSASQVLKGCWQISDGAGRNKKINQILDKITCNEILQRKWDISWSDSKFTFTGRTC